MPAAARSLLFEKKKLPLTSLLPIADNKEVKHLRTLTKEDILQFYEVMYL